MAWHGLTGPANYADSTTGGTSATTSSNLVDEITTRKTNVKRINNYET
jgi:hypothetical protein